LGREHVDIFVEFGAQECPPGAEMPVEAAGFVLGEDEDAAEAAIDAVG
jgi:hypothetical protein